jgi:hypothetical protein
MNCSWAKPTTAWGNVGTADYLQAHRERTISRSGATVPPSSTPKARRRSDFVASVEEWLIDGSCSGVMDRPAYYQIEPNICENWPM